MGSKNRNVLITGGNGFIGEHLVKNCLKNNFNVGIMGRKPLKKNDIQDGTIFHNIDITDKEKIQSVLEDYDILVHLAARTGQGHLEDPIYDFNINAFGTLNLLWASTHSKIKKIVYISTAEVYGDPLYTPITEDHRIYVKTPYAASKFTGELYCNLFNELYDIETVILRLFNVYGPPISLKNNKGVINSLIKQILSKNKISVNKYVKKDFVFIQDVVDAILKSMLHDFEKATTMNVGSGTSSSLLEIVNQLTEYVDYNPIIEYFETDKSIVCADITKIKKVLEWEPKYSINDGLRESIEWHKKTYS